MWETTDGQNGRHETIERSNLCFLECEIDGAKIADGGQIH
jgi:hypothetical protein